MKVGFIGLGTMGSHMALNVRKGGHDVVVHDLREAAAGPHLAAGCSWASSAREVAEKSDVVFTSLPNPRRRARYRISCFYCGRQAEMDWPPPEAKR